MARPSLLGAGCEELVTTANPAARRDWLRRTRPRQINSCTRLPSKPMTHTLSPGIARAGDHRAV
eukprot:13614112-Alexandrium_andersonii.AAC.1